MSGIVAWLSRALALAGGVTLLAVAALTVTSVVLRWLTSQPIRGDVELAALGSGVAVLGCFAHGSFARANIIVDSVTTWLPRRCTDALDAFWSLAWAAALLVLAWRSAVGAREALRDHSLTMGMLGVPIFWAVGFGALCFAAAALAALHWAGRLARGAAGDGRP
ncbi:MAG TPA: TRAP transporter small permease subunit [Roseomonas sp.]